jgi:hypothetical protein
VRKPRADRIELDFNWSDHGAAGAPESGSRRGTHRSGHREERPVQSVAPVPAGPRVSEPLPTPTIDDVVAHTASIAPTPMPTGPMAGVLGAPQDTATARRTVVIRGHGSRGYAPSRGGYEARLRPHERSGFKPDRVALWAVLLGLALLLGAVTSSHAATLHAGALHHLLLHHALIHPAP